jgi:DNA anti-recombination protein RmuC
MSKNSFLISLAVIASALNFALYFNQNKKIQSIMKRQEEFDQALQDLDKETTDLGNRIDQELGDLKDAGVSEESIGRLSAISNRLKSLAVDSNNPVPADGGITDEGNGGTNTGNGGADGSGADQA